MWGSLHRAAPTRPSYLPLSKFWRHIKRSRARSASRKSNVKPCSEISCVSLRACISRESTRLRSWHDSEQKTVRNA